MVFKTLPGQKTHIEEKHCEIFHKCTVCPVAFKTKEGCEVHLLNKHSVSETPPQWVNNPWPAFFKVVHLRLQFIWRFFFCLSFSSRLIFKCSCETVFKKKQLLLEHFHQNANKRVTSVFKCPECNSVFPQKHLLMQHFKVRLGWIDTYVSLSVEMNQFCLCIEKLGESCRYCWPYTICAIDRKLVSETNLTDDLFNRPQFTLADLRLNVPNFLPTEKLLILFVEFVLTQLLMTFWMPSTQCYHLLIVLWSVKYGNDTKTQQFLHWSCNNCQWGHLYNVTTILDQFFLKSSLHYFAGFVSLSVLWRNNAFQRLRFYSNCLMESWHSRFGICFVFSDFKS